MKTLWLSLTALACLTTIAAAQQMSAARRYDRTNEVTIRGTVVEVRDIARVGTPRGTYLILRTPISTLNVHLGARPAALKGRTSLSAGDSVEVVGWLANRAGSQVFLAREVRKDGATLTFRNDRGFPTMGGRQKP